jgi:hypothetical protein
MEGAAVRGGGHRARSRRQKHIVTAGRRRGETTVVCGGRQAPVGDDVFGEALQHKADEGGGEWWLDLKKGGVRGRAHRMKWPTVASALTLVVAFRSVGADMR